MKNLTIKQLRYFEALALHCHFGRAAEACSISQPALSLQIKELEETLNVTLFERGRRLVRLTAFGEEFSIRVHEILRSIDALGDLARGSQSWLEGTLRMGIIPTIAPYLLPAIIRNLSQTYPKLDLQMRETQTQKLIQELNEGRLDSAILALPVSEPSLVETKLFEEEFVLVRSSADEGKPIPKRDKLREMKLLLLEEGHCFRDQALSFCNVGVASPKEMLEGSSLSTLVQMVGAGIGITLIPEMAVSVETRSAPVSIARFGMPKPTRAIGMIWRKTSPLSKQLIQISDLVRQSAHAMQHNSK
ncbi:MAG: LysR substrate-binding domain-containing protein [Hyphomicrobiales bacterium]